LAVAYFLAMKLIPCALFICDISHTAHY